MSLNIQHRPLSSALGCVLLAVLLSAGFLVCMLNSGDPECAFGGCSLYSGATVFGASLFTWGAGVFGLLICALPTRYFRTFSILAVAADVPLLVWQVIFGPCGKCLLVAGLLLSTILVAGWGEHPRRSTKMVLCIAAALLCINLGSLVGNTVRPWLIEQIRTTSALQGLRVFLPPVPLLPLQDRFFGSPAR